MGFESIELFERTGVQQKFETLARGELSLLVLAFDALDAPSNLGLCVEFVELLDLILDRQDQYSFWAWRTVIAVTLITSSTVAVG
jgi:hypothetical protein